MRRVTKAVPLSVCKERALAYMRKQPKEEFVKASSVAFAIWPTASFTGQGAGASASRVLLLLVKDGLVFWDSDVIRGDWGYKLTIKGRA